MECRFDLTRELEIWRERESGAIMAIGVFARVSIVSSCDSIVSWLDRNCVDRFYWFLCLFDCRSLVFRLRVRFFGCCFSFFWMRTHPDLIIRVTPLE